RTGTAFTLLTRILRTRIAELLAQRQEQRLTLPTVGLGLDAVHAQRDPHRGASSECSRLIQASSRARAASARGARDRGTRPFHARRRSAPPPPRRAPERTPP